MEEAEDFEIAKGDLEGLMARHDHVRRWVEDFEAQHGTRPYFYGPLDRGAKSIEPRNLIYSLKPPLFAHIYKPEDDDEQGAGTTLWFGIEPVLNEEEEVIRQEIVDRLLRDAPSAPSFTSDSEFEGILEGMIERMTTTSPSVIQADTVLGPAMGFLGFGESSISVSPEQLERLKYIIIRDLVKSGPLEALLSDEMLEDIHSVGLRYINMDHKVFGMVTSNIRFRDREVLARYLRSMSERIGRPVSDSNQLLTVRY